MVWVIRNKIPFQKPYLTPISIYRSFSPFWFIHWYGGDWGGNIPFPRKMSFSIKFSIELNYLQFELDIFSLPIILYYESKVQNKTSRRQILVVVINISSAKRTFYYLEFIKMYILLNTGGFENLHSYSQVNVYIKTTINLMFT